MACVETYGDHIYLYDTAADSAHPEVYFVLENAGYAVAFGWCRQYGGANTVADCDFDFPEESYVHFVAARVDGSTLQDFSDVASADSGAARIVAPSASGSDRAEARTELKHLPEPQKMPEGGDALVEQAEPAPVDGMEGGPEGTVRMEVRALSLDEVQQRGLGEHVDASHYAPTAPQVKAENSLGVVPSPQQRQEKASAQATGCWEGSVWAGVKDNSDFPLELYGQTDITWCGDGQWVTYSASGCWGDENWPFYKFMGCTIIDDFGFIPPDTYYNVYDVWSQWELCPLYATKWGGCFQTDRPQAKYRLTGAGEAFLLSSNA
ncbi:hypothetical protein [Streptomyces albidoflavus]|uniref:hypothetical protein n=1 Tax=Streptomyces albidoflavus TaxID=1886 RepID=UPI0033F17809